MPESTTEVLQDHPQIIKELIHCTVDLMVQYSRTYNNKIMEINQTINAEQEAQQKEYKRIKDAMKADIKNLSTQQTTTKFMCASDETLANGGISRNISQSQAQCEAYLNGVDLRHLFIAYAIFRIQGGRKGKFPEQHYGFSHATGTLIYKSGKFPPHGKPVPRIELVTKILEKYGASIKQSTKVVYPGS